MNTVLFQKVDFNSLKQHFPLIFDKNKARHDLKTLTIYCVNKKGYKIFASVALKA